MTDRELMQQALHTLEGWANHGEWVWPESALEQAKRNTTESIAALREALAEQPAQQEPVAYWNFNNGFSHCMIDQLNEAAKKNPAPLYTIPPQRKPLTPDLEADTGYGPDELAAFRAGWEAAEAAHGIKE